MSCRYFVSLTLKCHELTLDLTCDGVMFHYIVENWLDKARY